MRGKFRILFSDQFTRISILLSVIFLVPLIIIIGFSFGRLPALIPFFNSMPWGEERLINSQAVLALPILITGIFILNSVLAVFSYSRYVLVARIIMFNTFLFLLLGLLAYLQILFLTF